jgi:lipopolysaccharide heptosyltransferase II
VPDRVLVVRMSSIGDVVLTEPVVAALRAARPGIEIGFAVKAALRDLVAGNKDISTIHTLAGPSPLQLASLCREVRARRYSAVVDLHANLRSALVARASAAPLVSVYRKRDPGVWFSVRVRHRPFRAAMRIVDRYLSALAPLGVHAQHARVRFHAASRDVAWAGGFLPGRGLSPGSFIAVAPGAVWSTKRWPADRYGAVVQELSLETGLPAVLVGSAAERGLCEAVAAGAGRSVRTTVAAGEATLGGTAAIIAGAALYIGNDSGLTHIAAALGTPTVAIFGPTDPGQFDFEGHAVVFADVQCSACSFFGGESCRLGHWECMRLIQPEDVLRASRGLLAARGRGT